MDTVGNQMRWKMAKKRNGQVGLLIAGNVIRHRKLAVQEFIELVPGWTEAIIDQPQTMLNDADFNSAIRPTRESKLC